VSSPATTAEFFAAAMCAVLECGVAGVPGNPNVQGAVLASGSCDRLLLPRWSPWAWLISLTYLTLRVATRPPDAKAAPHGDQLTHMVGIVISDEQQLPQVRLPGTMGNALEEIHGAISRKLLQFT